MIPTHLAWPVERAPELLDAIAGGLGLEVRACPPLEVPSLRRRGAPSTEAPRTISPSLQHPHLPFGHLPPGVEGPVHQPDARGETGPHAASSDAPRTPEVGAPTPRLPPERWWSQAGRVMGVEVVPAYTLWSEADRTLASGAPAVVVIEPDALLGLVGARGDRVELLGLDGRRHPVARAEVRRWMRAKLDAQYRPATLALLERVGLAGARLAMATRAVLDERLADAPLAPLYLVRSPPGAPARVQLAEAGAWGPLVGWLVALLTAQAAGIAAWATLGRGVLGGQVAWGWLLAWALLLGTAAVLSTAGTWFQGGFALAAGRWLKVRLLAGALRLDPDAVRHLGTGQWLGRVIESEAVEQLALGGGLAALTGLVEIGSAALLLGAGAGGRLQVGLLVAALIAALLATAAWYRRRRAWTASRVALTGEVVERLVGQRTRRVQLGAARWHEGEDASLDRYLAAATAMDATTPLPTWAVHRGWTWVGLAALAPAWLAGASPEALALALGGVLMAGNGLGRLGSSLVNLATAAIAWETVRSLYEAARADPTPPGSGAGEAGDGPVLDASGLVFGYPRAEPVLRGASLVVEAGDRLLLEGPSGGGKSTLAAVLAGLRVAQGGLLLLGGLDRRTLGGDAWRRRVAYTPQFHENHVMAETLAFNLMMGRSWPPTPDESAEAEALCRALGLGPMLDSMPSGMLQQVGEAGRRLSHGEQSRLFIARALLQNADVVILDESFGALDPDNMERALRVVLERARTVVVLAHP